MNEFLGAFTNPSSVASYDNDTARRVPGQADLHRMTTLLLSEQAPGRAQILVVGAGGGLELAAMARARPGWRFTGVDPSPAMLDIARRTAASHANRIDLLKGTVEQAPNGPFDGATCLLTLHFLTRADRLHTLKAIRRRLKRGGILVIAHHTSPDDNPQRWMMRSVVFADRADADPANAAASAKMMAERLPLLSPADEEALLREAGFIEPALFYAALSFRGWIATAG